MVNASVVCRVASTVVICAAAIRAQAQNIDALFAQFNQWQDSGNYRQAEQTARQMVRVSTTSGWRAASLNSLGRALNSQGRADEAVEHYKRAMAISLSSDNVNRGWIPLNLGNAYVAQRHFEEAETLLKKAESFFAGLKGARSSEVASVSQALGSLEHDRERYAESEAYHRRALTIREGLFGKEHVDVSYSLMKLGDVYRHLKRYSDSETYLNRALSMQERMLGKNHPEVATTLYNLGVLYRETENYAAAETVDRRALAIYERLGGPSDADFVETLENLLVDVEKQQKPDEAEAIRAQLDELKKSKKRIEVVAEEADVKDGANVLGVVKKGQQYEVKQVNNAWYAIEIDVGGVRKTGWVLNTKVAPVRPAGATANQEKAPTAIWQQLTPPAGRFSVSFPGQAKSLTQKLGDIDNQVFSYETSDSVYMVSYFDVPVDRRLTFDAAIGAYTTARKGALQSQKSFDVDLYPGREFSVKLPNGNISKMRIISVGRRWYQIIIEAGALGHQRRIGNQVFGLFQAC